MICTLCKWNEQSGDISELRLLLDTAEDFSFSQPILPAQTPCKFIKISFSFYTQVQKPEKSQLQCKRSVFARRLRGPMCPIFPIRFPSPESEF